MVQEFSSRRARNPSYSLRAFARDLGIGVTSLSDFLAAKRKLSKSNILRISEALRLSPQQKDTLLQESRRKPIERSEEEAQRLLIEDETFRLIADWHYLAILNLAKLKHNRSSPSWIAKRLNIPLDTAKEALERLSRLGLLEKREGKLFRTSQAMSTTHDVPSAAIRKHHADKLRLAENSLFCDSVEVRDFSSITIPTDPKKLPQAKAILAKARQRIGKLLEEGELSEVYVLNIQLFPLTRPLDTETKT